MTEHDDTVEDDPICDHCAYACGEQDEDWCDHCGEHHDPDDHEFFYCGDCDWGCEVPDCQDCLSYSDQWGGMVCDSCYERLEHSYGSGPGESVRTCACCAGLNVHHDEVTERFLCDCEAARRIAAKYPVRLAYELPTLEVA